MMQRSLTTLALLTVLARPARPADDDAARFRRSSPTAGPAGAVYLAHAALDDIHSCLGNRASFAAIENTDLGAGARTLRTFLNGLYKLSAKDSLAFLLVSEDQAAYKLARDRGTEIVEIRWTPEERKEVLKLLAWYKANGRRLERAQKRSKAAAVMETWATYEALARSPLTPREEVISFGADLAVTLSEPTRASELAFLKATNQATAVEIATFLKYKDELVWYGHVVSKDQRPLLPGELRQAAKALPADWSVAAEFIADPAAQP